MSIFKSFFGKSGQSKTNRVASPKRDLRFESLENRELLSVSPLGNASDDLVHSELSTLECAGCAAYDPELDPNFNSNPVVQEAAGPTSEAAPFALSQTFLLNSNPGAKHTIYLDFTGNTTPGTGLMWDSNQQAWWTNNVNPGADIVTPVFSLDSDTNFSNTELEMIQNIWRRVAEDYMPFDVNVTTQDPGTAALIKTDASDDAWGIRVAIGGSNSDWLGSAGTGGIAYLGSFSWSQDVPCFIFIENLGKNEKNIAEAISHEVGHTLGLSHDGRSNPLEDYYSGADGWAPIMGIGYYQSVVHWSKGEYENANNTQDDLAIITGSVLVPYTERFGGNGFGYRADDHGDDRDSATELEFVEGSFFETGIIETNTDVDFFQFSFNRDVYLNLDAFSGSRDANLDILLKLYNATGTQLAMFNPIDSLHASIEGYELAAGTYYVSIEGTGKMVGTKVIYTDYGSIGSYTLSATIARIDDVGDTLETAEPIVFHDDLYQTVEKIGNGPHLAKDVDIYSLVVREEDLGRTYTFVASLPEGDDMEEVDTYFRLFDADGNEIDSNDDGNGYYSVITFIPDEVGTYYLGVSGRNNTAYDPEEGGSGVDSYTGDYLLTVTRTALVAELVPYERPEWDAAAVIISTSADGGPVDGATIDDDVYFNFAYTNIGTIPVGKDYQNRIVVTRTDRTAPTETFYLDGIKLGVGEIGFLESNFNLGRFAAGNYRISIYLDTYQDIAEEDETNNTFTFDFTVGDGDHEDVGDAFDKATEIDFAGGSTFTYQDRIGNGTYGNADVDLYKLVVTADDIGRTYSFDMNLPTGIGFVSFNSYIQIFDADGNRIALNDNKNSSDSFSFVRFAPVEAGTYYIGISSNLNIQYDPQTEGTGTPGDTGNYVLSVGRTSASAPKVDLKPLPYWNIGTEPIILTNTAFDNSNPYNNPQLATAKYLSNRSPVYLSYQLGNLAATSSTGFVCTITITGGDLAEPIVFRFEHPGGLGAEINSFLVNRNLSNFDPGIYTLELVVNSEYNVAESDYSNNRYTMEFRVKDPTEPEPDLAPYAIDAWNDSPILLSKGVDNKGKEILAETFTEGEDIYFNFAFVNNGTKTAASPFVNSVTITGGSLASPIVHYFDQETDLPVEGWEKLLENFKLDPLDLGLYTITVHLNCNDDFFEWDDANNIFSRTFTVLPKDIGDTFDTAEEVVFGAGDTYTKIDQLGNGEFAAKDVDMYKFVVTEADIAAGRFYTFQTSFPSLNFIDMNDWADTYIRIFDADGNELAWNNDYSQQNLYSRLEFAPLEAGTYYLGVSDAVNKSYDPNVGGSGKDAFDGFYQLTVTRKDAQLDTPQVTATPQVDGSIQLEWEAIAGATYYEVWRKTGEGEWVLLHARVYETTFVDPSAPVGTNSYAVRAYQVDVNTGNTISAVSRVAPIQATVLPAAPEVTATVLDNGKVRLEWNPVDGAEYYSVKMKNDSGQWVSLDNHVTETYFEAAVPPGERSFEVYAHVGALVSLPGQAEIEAPLANPDPVASIEADGRVRIAWDAVPGAQFYIVDRLNADGQWETIAENLTATFYIDGTAFPPEATYKIKAFADPYYSASDEITIEITIAAPVVATPVVEDGNVKLEWQEVPIAEYYVVKRKNSRGEWITIGDRVTEKTFVDKTAPSGLQSYSVQAVSNGIFSGQSVVDILVPIGVPQVTAELLADDNVKLQWNRIDGATHYGVWRLGADGKWIALDRNVAGTSFIDTTVSPGEQSYAVRAYVDAVYSDFVPVKIVIPIDTPQVTAELVADDDVKLQWEAIDGATHYGVWRLGTDGKWIALDKNVGETTFTDMNAPLGRQTYAVRAYVDAVYSDFIPVKIDIPIDVPQVTAELLAGGDIKLQWEAIDGATHYGVWRLGTDGKWIALDRNVDETTFTDTEVPPGPQTYAVRAYIGTAYSDFKPVTVDLPIGVPQVTAELVADDNVKLQWEAIDGATHYGVWRLGTDGKWIALDRNVDGTTFVDMEAPGGKQSYAVRAYIGTVYSDFKPVAVNVPIGVPQVTAELVADDNVKLQWSPIDGATHYGVWRLGTDGKWIALDRNVDGTTYVDTETPQGTQTYAVRAYVGTAYSDFIPVKIAIPIDTPQVTGTLRSDGSVQLQWSPVDGATHYGVWRLGTDGKWIALDRNVDETAYVETTPPVGTQTYAVRAYVGTAYSGFEPVVVVVDSGYFPLKIADTSLELFGRAMTDYDPYDF